MASAEMAAKWERFAEDGDEYNLQYRTVGDERVRPEHAAIHEVTLPMSDPFWAEYYPPNGWGCRCDVVQVRKSKYPVTDHDEAMELGAQALQRDKKGMFHFNPGIEGKTFPDYNPYTISRCRDCDIAKGKGKFARTTPPDNTLCEACQFLQCQKRDEPDKVKKRAMLPIEERDRILSLPYEEQFKTVYGKDGVCVHQHLMVCVESDDYSRVLAAAKGFANAGYECYMNPEISFKAPGRKSYYTELPSDSKSNPDLTVKGIGYVDVKSPLRENNCCTNANHASIKQHSYACLTNIHLNISEEQIEKRTQSIWREGVYIHDKVFWLINGKLHIYKKPR